MSGRPSKAQNLMDTRGSYAKMEPYFSKKTSVIVF